jgi:hypothetical protein
MLRLTYVAPKLLAAPAKKTEAKKAAPTKRYGVVAGLVLTREEMLAWDSK